MTNNGKFFADKLTNWLIYESGLNHYKCQMYIYYKYALDGSKLVVLYYVYECLCWYTYEEIEKWFVDTLGKIFNANFLGYLHWFMSISISQLKDHYISVDQARYDTSVIEKYLDTFTIKENYKFHKTTLPHNMIFTK